MSPNTASATNGLISSAITHGSMRAVCHLAALVCALVVGMPATAAEVVRDPAQVRAFRKANPCPSTGKTRGACRGWVVDHVIPLCGGGDDRPENMQWQRVAAAAAKDKREVRYCACLRANKPACEFKP